MGISSTNKEFHGFDDAAGSYKERFDGLMANGISMGGPVHIEAKHLGVTELVEYLKRAEGTYLHYNVGEKGITADTGIYYTSFPKWEGWDFISQVAQEIGMTNFTPMQCSKSGLRELSKAIHDNYYEEFYGLIEKFVQEEYIDKLRLDEFPGAKSALSYFSIVVNGGAGRGGKILQKVLNSAGAGLVVDGKPGNKTFAALTSIPLDDAYLNQELLQGMQDFYDYLIRKNPSKYGRFGKGWTNRLIALGYEG